MGFDGNGNWSSDFYPITDRDNGVAILASKFQTLIQSNLKDSFENCILRDGTGRPTTNINWNGYKVTNLAAGTNVADAVNKSQLDAKVSKTGDTMTGQLNINLNQTHLKLLDSNVNSATTPDSAIYGNYIDFTGTTGGALGRIACRSGAEGNDLLFQAFDGDNSDSTSMGIRVSKDGNTKYAYAPTPSANASGLEIATAAWVRSLLTSGGSDGIGWFQQWVRFPNGLQICWGNTAEGITTVTFPMPFKDATISIIQGDLYSTRTDRMTYSEKRINSWSATGFVYEWAGIQRAYVALGFWK